MGKDQNKKHRNCKKLPQHPRAPTRIDEDIFKFAMRTMLLSSLVGIYFIEISMLTAGVSIPNHGIPGLARRRPLFVGRRQSPSSSYLNDKVTPLFGKKVSPIFLGRRRNGEFLVKTKNAPLFLGKKVSARVSWQKVYTNVCWKEDGTIISG